MNHNMFQVPSFPSALKVRRLGKFQDKAFTIVELLVAMGLFLVLMGIATGGFVRALRTQKAIVGLMEANDNASLALEQMAREMRTGSNFSSITNGISFTNVKGESVTYDLNEEAIERNNKKITADNVKITDFKIVLLGNNPGDDYPPRITISLSVTSPDKYLQNVLTNIQTTISSRALDS